jgi:hypothetical protein
MGCIVGGKLGERKSVEPVILLVVAEEMDVRFELLIHTFRLTVRLKVKSRRFPGVNFENRGEGRPEVGSEDGTAFRDNGIGETMEADNIGDDEFSEFRGCRAVFSIDRFH